MLETPWVTSCAVRAASVLSLYIHTSDPRFVSFQGVPQPVHQWGDGVFLPPGDGRGHHPVRLRPSCRSFRKVVQNRCEYRSTPLPHFTAFCMKLTACFLSADERLHQSPQRSASEQRRRPPQRSQVSSCWNQIVFSPYSPACNVIIAAVWQQTHFHWKGDGCSCCELNDICATDRALGLFHSPSAQWLILCSVQRGFVRLRGLCARSRVGCRKPLQRGRLHLTPRPLTVSQIFTRLAWRSQLLELTGPFLWWPRISLSLSLNRDRHCPVTWGHSHAKDARFSFSGHRSDGGWQNIVDIHSGGK